MTDISNDTDGFVIETMWGGSLLEDIGNPGDFVLIFLDTTADTKMAAPFLSSEIAQLLSLYPLKLIGFGHLLGFQPFSRPGEVVRQRPTVAWKRTKEMQE